MRQFVILSIVLSSLAVAQQPASTSTGAERLEQWRKSRASVYMNDFGELARYREENALLSAPSPDEKRVVFFGDSITDGWRLQKYFPGKNYINRGIGGQTTSQMLVRFRQDVIDLNPDVVVILAGTNDIAGNTGPISLQDIEANLASMAELASAHNIRVVLSSVTPVHDYTPASRDFYSTRPPAKILELNLRLKKYCAENHAFYLNYFDALSDDKGLMKREFAEDGLHPNDAGYALMAPIAASVIEEALK